MVWIGASVPRYIYPAVHGAAWRQSAFFTPLGEAIAASNPNWTVTQDIIFNSTSCILVLTHSTGAQIAFSCPQSNYNVANCFSDSASPADEFWAAYNPTYPAGTWATVSDSVNPADTSTWCDDANSYRFLHAASTDCFSINEFELIVLTDSLNANVVVLSIQRLPRETEVGCSNIFIFGNDTNGADVNDVNWHTLADGAETYKSFAIKGGSAGLYGKSYWAGWYQSGVRQEVETSSYAYYNHEIHDSIYQPDTNLTTYMADRILYTRRVADGGRKGLIDESFVCGIGLYVPENIILDAGYRMHWRLGLVTAWAPNLGKLT